MYETILIPTDGSAGSMAAAAHALDIAAAADATVHVLYVLDTRMTPVSSGMDREEVLALVEASDEDPTGPILQRAEAAGVPAVETIQVGIPHETILDYIADHDIDLVVMGTHGRTGLQHALLGSVTERVVRTADVPVLSVHPE
ncbi:MAG: universal stress protein [Halorientalis sp.]